MISLTILGCCAMVCGTIIAVHIDWKRGSALYAAKLQVDEATRKADSFIGLLNEVVGQRITDLEDKVSALAKSVEGVDPEARITALDWQVAGLKSEVESLRANSALRNL